MGMLDDGVQLAQLDELRKQSDAMGIPRNEPQLVPALMGFVLIIFGVAGAIALLALVISCLS